MNMKLGMRVVIAVATALAVNPVLAAEIGITPPTLTMVVSAGESGSTTVVGNVIPAPTIPVTLALQLRSVAGSMPPSWLATAPLSLSNRIGPLLLPLTVKVPPTAKAGTYTAVIQAVVLSANIAFSPSSRMLQLTVKVSSKCTAAPAVSIVSTEPAEFKSPNNRLADVTVAGGIVVPPGCALARAWYTLADEYGIFEETKELAAAAGPFEFTLPVQVSRRGDDRDGRAYNVTVYAEDEAGCRASAPATVLVRHDQRTTK